MLREQNVRLDDLMPLIREAYDIAKREGLLRFTRFEDLRVTSTNIGFEMFGEFDAAVQIKDMSLTAVTAE